MAEKLILKNSWENELPEGWTLGRVYLGKRTLFFKEIKVKAIADDFNIQKEVLKAIENPNPEVQAEMVKLGILKPENITEKKVQKLLLKKQYISNESAYRLYPELRFWLDKQKPLYAEYAGNTYRYSYRRWLKADGSILDSRKKFISTWDARVQYAKGSCTLKQVAEYSWAAVLECLGDDHQRLYNYIKQQAEENKRICVQEAKRELERKEKENFRYEYSYPDAYKDYLKQIDSTLLDHFTASIENATLMFTKECVLERFKWVKDYVQDYASKVANELFSGSSRLVSFRWDSGMQFYQPVLAPKQMSSTTFQKFYNLMTQVITGKMSGYEARLRFTNGAYKNIKAEKTRYQNTMCQYVPFFQERHIFLRKESISFNAAVQYVHNTMQDLAVLGYRSLEKKTTSFIYGDLKFCLDLMSRNVRYIGYARGRYASTRLVKMSKKAKQEYLSDEQEREYQETGIKKFNRLFSYLQNVVHKSCSAIYRSRDKKVAAEKYLKPSPRFLKGLKRKAEELISGYERSRCALC